MARKRSTKKAEEAEATAEVLTSDPPRLEAIKQEDLLSTGSTLLNMAFSGRPGGGVPKGKYLYFVGDSSSGKSWFCFNLFAEAARNPNFEDYRFVFDNAENGALMDVEEYFGKRVVERLVPPKGTIEEPIYSETVQQFYYHLDANTEQGPCIYVLDSMDALNDESEEDKFDAEVKKYETGKGEVPGSMGMAKAKANSKNINRVVRSLRNSGSILVVISQTRDAVGSRIPGMKTRGGGKALRFYAHLEAWTSVKCPITKTYLRKDREIGSIIKIDVQKNRVCGWEGKIEVPFLKKYGVDDLGGCVDYLRDEKHWKGASGKGDDDEDSGSGKFAAPEFDFTGTKEGLIKKIQESGDEWELQRLVARVWRDIEAGAMPYRKPKY
jgi:RecA/RadA recombinase